MLTRDTGLRFFLDGNINHVGKQKSIRKRILSLTAVSTLEELTRTCHWQRRHVAGQNATERIRGVRLGLPK